MEANKILNFRDVGTTINRITSSQLVKSGKLFRSARPDDASPSEQRALVDQHGIKHIIDLRTPTEHIEQSKRRNTNVVASALVPKTEEQVAGPLRIPGITHHDINFNGSAFSRSLLWQLSWWNITKLLSLMVLGYRLEAISILGRNVMAPRGLIGLGIDSVDACKAEVRMVFDLLANEDKYPICVHCTQGKDRTGLIVMLVLLLLDVSIEAINEDYMMSGPELESEKDGRLKEIQSIGLGKEFAECSPELVQKVSEHLVNKYDGVVGYLEACGVTKEMMEKVKAILAP
ncbi:tyrosine/serine phosphatase-like protein [Patellaria atrata CBS 101060]|uniref:Tyrosine/serine phosphatase-like protein n=1 Tax=Patellaria atrata CBS 101060 TaxID=1346257 RepID=A0A9P4SHP3_9PEZI|nr:tyrosine/serine phosphatase-like protein [Patellaria atrata CBS 101060]